MSDSVSVRGSDTRGHVHLEWMKVIIICSFCVFIMKLCFKTDSLGNKNCKLTFSHIWQINYSVCLQYYKLYNQGRLCRKISRNINIFVMQRNNQMVLKKRLIFQRVTKLNNKRAPHVLGKCFSLSPSFSSWCWTCVYNDHNSTTGRQQQQQEAFGVRRQNFLSSLSHLIKTAEETLLRRGKPWPAGHVRHVKLFNPTRWN